MTVPRQTVKIHLDFVEENAKCACACELPNKFYPKQIFRRKSITRFAHTKTPKATHVTKSIPNADTTKTHHDHHESLRIVLQKKKITFVCLRIEEESFQRVPFHPEYLHLFVLAPSSSAFREQARSRKNRFDNGKILMMHVCPFTKKCTASRLAQLTHLA